MKKILFAVMLFTSIRTYCIPTTCSTLDGKCVCIDIKKTDSFEKIRSDINKAYPELNNNFRMLVLGRGQGKIAQDSQTFNEFFDGERVAITLVKGIPCNVDKNNALKLPYPEKFFTKREVGLGSTVISCLMYGFLEKNVNSALLSLITGYGLYYSIETLIGKTINKRLEAINNQVSMESSAHNILNFLDQEVTDRNAQLDQLPLLMSPQKIREGSMREVIAILNALTSQRKRIEEFENQNQNGLVEKSNEMKTEAKNFAEAARKRAELITAERKLYKENNPGIWGSFKVFCKDIADDWKYTL